MGLILALDIGGTKMAAGIVDDSGALLVNHATPTPRTPDAEQLFKTLLDLCEKVLATKPRDSVIAIGVGCGGPMDYATGRVSPLNIPAWREFPLRDRLTAAFHWPTVVDNDAKAYALGEHWVGEGQGSRALLGMVVSTGVGGGIVLEGKLIHGARGNAGHIGHVIADPGGRQCACGARGCVEAIASGPSIVRQIRDAISSGRRTGLTTTASAADVAAAARAGDALAQEVFANVGKALGRGIAAACALIDLDRVVIGGGVSAAADLFSPVLRAELDRIARLEFCREIDVRVSSLVGEPSLVGAAALTAAQHWEERD